MTTILIALSTWLHNLATIVMVGYFFFSGLIYLPVFQLSMPQDALRELLEHVSTRLRPFFGGSLLIYLVTGTYLMLINDSYLGLGNFFANPWSILIILKHAVVVVFLALAILSERAYMGKISENNPKALKQFSLTLNINTILGMVILLMTSFAQAG
jgi:uncharacterized membrane protein